MTVMTAERPAARPSSEEMDVLIENAQFLLDMGEEPVAICPRLGVTPDALAQAMYRRRARGWQQFNRWQKMNRGSRTLDGA